MCCRAKLPWSLRIRLFALLSVSSLVSCAPALSIPYRALWKTERFAHVEFTLYRSEVGFSELHSEWNDLLQRSRIDTIFLTWEWQSTWWRHFGASRGLLYLLAARVSGRLIGLLPLYESSTDGRVNIQVVGCIEVSDYLDLIVEAGQEEVVYTALIAWLAGPEAPAWDVVDLCNQPAASFAHTRLPELVREAGWTAEVVQEDVCPAIELPRGEQPADSVGGWEAYLEKLDKKERHEIRRKLRRMEREAPGYQVRLVEDSEQLEVEVARFVDLHRLSSKAKDQFMTEGMQEFFAAVANALAGNGWLQISFLEIGERAVASYFCFDYRGEILVYNSGYDPQASPHLSAGWVLLARLIQRAIATGHSRFDFLQGNEDYKYRFGGVDSPIYRTLIQRA